MKIPLKSSEFISKYSATTLHDSDGKKVATEIDQDDADYIIKACNMYPELVDVLESIIDSLGGECMLDNWVIDEIKSILTRAK